MTRIRTVALTLAAALPLAAFAPAEGRFCGAYDADSARALDGAQRKIEQALEERGLTPASIVVDAQTQGRDDNRNGAGYLGWVKVTACPDGQVLVRLDRLCNVQSVTGRGSCSEAVE